MTVARAEQASASELTATFFDEDTADYWIAWGEFERFFNGNLEAGIYAFQIALGFDSENADTWQTLGSKPIVLLTIGFDSSTLRRLLAFSSR